MESNNEAHRGSVPNETPQSHIQDHRLSVPNELSPALQHTLKKPDLEESSMIDLKKMVSQQKQNFKIPISVVSTTQLPPPVFGPLTSDRLDPQMSMLQNMANLMYEPQLAQSKTSKAINPPSTQATSLQGKKSQKLKLTKSGQSGMPPGQLEAQGGMPMSIETLIPVNQLLKPADEENINQLNQVREMIEETQKTTLKPIQSTTQMISQHPSFLNGADEIPFVRTMGGKPLQLDALHFQNQSQIMNTGRTIETMGMAHFPVQPSVANLRQGAGASLFAPEKSNANQSTFQGTTASKQHLMQGSKSTKVKTRTESEGPVVRNFSLHNKSSIEDKTENLTDEDGSSAIQTQQLSRHKSLQKPTTVRSMATLNQPASAQSMARIAKSPRLQNAMYPFNKGCFNASISNLNAQDIKMNMDNICSVNSLQIIFVKLWDLGKFIKYYSKVHHNVPAYMKRNERKMSQQKLGFMKQNLDTAKNIPLRVLTIPEAQSLLCKIMLAIYIVIESSLSISKKVFNFEKLGKKALEKNEISFKEFKPLIMSLFGNNLFTLSSVDIDSILRKVHRELIVFAPEQQDQKPAEERAEKNQMKTITDADLDKLLGGRGSDSKQLKEYRDKCETDMLSKRKLIGTEDLINHVMQAKFGTYPYYVKDRYRKELLSIMKDLFPKANFSMDEQYRSSSDQKGNISKVRKHIKEMKKPKFYEERQLLPEEEEIADEIENYQLTRKHIDVNLKTKIIWHRIEENQNVLFKGKKRKPRKQKDPEAQAKKTMEDFVHQLQAGAAKQRESPIEKKEKKSNRLVNDAGKVKVSKLISIQEDKLIRPEVTTVITNFDFDDEFKKAAEKPTIDMAVSFSPQMNAKSGIVSTKDTHRNQVSNASLIPLHQLQQQYNVSQPPTIPGTTISGPDTGGASRTRRGFMSSRASQVFMNATGQRKLFAPTVPQQKRLASAYCTAGAGRASKNQRMTTENETSAAEDVNVKIVDMKSHMDNFQNFQILRSSPSRNERGKSAQHSKLFKNSQSNLRSTRAISMGSQKSREVLNSFNSKGAAVLSKQFNFDKPVQIRRTFQRQQEESFESQPKERGSPVDSELSQPQSASDLRRKLKLNHRYSKSINRKPKLQARKKSRFDSMAQETKRNLMNRAFQTVKDDLTNQGIEVIDPDREAEQQSLRQKTARIRQIADEFSMGPVFHGKQAKGKIIPTKESLDSGLVEPNASNYKQVIQQVQVFKPQPMTTKAASASHSMANLQMAAPVRGSVKGLKIDNLLKKKHENRYIKNQLSESSLPSYRVHQAKNTKPPRPTDLAATTTTVFSPYSKNRLIAHDSIDQEIRYIEMSPTVSLQPEKNLQVTNYLVPEFIQSKENQIFTNSTMNNGQYNDLIRTLNRNEQIRERQQNIPRFGIQGKKTKILRVSQKRDQGAQADKSTSQIQPDELSMNEFCKTLTGMNNLIPNDYSTVSIEPDKLQNIEQVKYHDAWSEEDPDLLNRSIQKAQSKESSAKATIEYRRQQRR